MNRTVGIAGTGSIGVAFAVLFATAGFTVRMWDALPGAFDRARADLADRLHLLSRHGLLKEPIDAVSARVSYHEILLDCLEGAELVQECVPERLEIKREVFQQLGAYSEPDAVLASSSSAIVSSEFATSTPARDRVLVAHPGNPPYLIPVIELVPSAFTAQDTVERAKAIYREAGMTPILVNAEIEGFVFNRLQGALLREAYCLVRDGVASVDDIDEVVRSGLGRRWAFIGPFETVDLNTRGGIESHAEKMGPAYHRMGAVRGQDDPWTPELVAEVARQRRDILPLEQWEDRVRWRDEQLMALRRLLD
ncbi:3-hydroxyacyl-CoA dehydrogenase [Leifsonia sp. H3M29-4]|uniref:3-hydroxyacyl-CoA dehydrogenase n=1 Tax=Salinibacterium metalliresistens TaxID=3031321 RepID=UPI0023DA6DEE|nr:3-hydroxyacyl-CoA dehydrogenase [Salinibacterium metalliresistens]MDF1478317.1 3-hydroxyacyl-CoA dehydrogenase [Salinibacterium metalliresistens]